MVQADNENGRQGRRFAHQHGAEPQTDLDSNVASDKDTDISAIPAASRHHLPMTPNTSDAAAQPSNPLPTDMHGKTGPPAQAGPPADGQPGRSRGRIALIMFALAMAVFLAALDITIITTALPTISEHFHSASGYLWIGAAYQLAAAASTPLWGKVSDIWGRKPILLAANFVFFVGSLIAALSNSIAMLIAARAIQGVGGGGLLVLVNIAIGDLFSLRDRGIYYGIIGMVWAVAAATGPVIGGAFTAKVSWRWCFYINLPLDGLAFAIILVFLNLHTPRTPIIQGLKMIDWSGALLIIGGTLMLLFGLEAGGVSHPWTSATVICLIVFGVIGIGLFVVNEWRFAAYPIMPLRLFKYRSNCAALVVCFLHAFVFISANYFLPLYFQAVRGQSPLMSGVDLLPFVLALSLASAFTGIYIKKTGFYLPPIWFGMAVMTLGFGLYTDVREDSSRVKIIFYQLVAGLGTGPLFQAPLIALQTLVQPSDIGTATATFAFTRNLGLSISIIIGGVVYQNEMINKAPLLRAKLGDRLAAIIGGGNAGASTEIVKALPAAQKAVVRKAITDSLRPAWLMYTVLAGVGIFASLLITKQVLTRKHEDTQVGVEAEREKRRSVLEAKRAKRASAEMGGQQPTRREAEEV